MKSLDSHLMRISTCTSYVFLILFLMVLPQSARANAPVDYCANNTIKACTLQIACPANVTINANTSCQSELGDYRLAAVVSSTCSDPLTVTQSPDFSTILTGHSTSQTVTLTVNDTNGNTATCAFMVILVDAQPPLIACPENTTVSCEVFDPSLELYGQAFAEDNCSPSGSFAVSTSTNYTQFDTICNRGTITRHWEVTDEANNSAQCTQRIVVTYNQNYWIKFPADLLITACGTPFGAPEFYGEDCELLSASYTDAFITYIPMDECFKIERTWHVINWCTYKPNLPGNNPLNVFVPNPNPNPMLNHPSNLPGVTVSAPGTTVAGWEPTIVKVNFTDPTPTNYSVFWAKEANSYTYHHTIKIIDSTDPTIIPPLNPPDYCDYSANDIAFYNDTSYWDNLHHLHDLCEGEADMAIRASDACSGANLNFSYQLFLDMDNNGTKETVINSIIPPGFNTIYLNNAFNPNYSGGTPQAFDYRNVPANQKWGFRLQVDAAVAASRTARVRWVNQIGQNAVPQLPYGNHKIKWFVQDGCGNEVIYDQDIHVRDCKKPTVVCQNGIALNMENMQTGLLTLWTSDLTQYTEDNCTPVNQLELGTRRSGVPDGQGAITGFPRNADGTPQTHINFTCNDLGTHLVELWSLDKAGNADYCEAYALIQDNLGLCGPNATLGGTLKTEAAEGIEDIEVQLDGMSNGVPLLSEVFSNANGGYFFNNALPFGGDATIMPKHDESPLNGVNTADLIRISRHIFGIQPLNSPYKLIAADANNSGTITTTDVIDIRKVILGEYQNFPNNTSWRFIDKSQVFANPLDPFADTIREDIQMDSLLYSFVNGDFIGVKVGDVNGTANPGLLARADDRSEGTLLFDIQDRAVRVGEEFIVNFKADKKVAGYQFTIDINGLEVAGIALGEGMDSNQFGVFASAAQEMSPSAALSEHHLSRREYTEFAITVSADGGKGAFEVAFRATMDGQLSQMLHVSSRITEAVAFVDVSPLVSAALDERADIDETTKLDVAFRFNKGNNSTIEGVGFELYQTVPNPWNEQTSIGFYLPEATAATLTVFDAMGRVLHSRKGYFGKGNNSIVLHRADLHTSGVLYYQLETATHSAIEKMVLKGK